MASIAGPVSRNLVCHPQSHSRAVRGIDVVVDGASGDILAVSFTLKGDLRALLIPETRPFRQASNLWQHTCFEVFVMAGEGPEYREFNLSPSGEWAIHAFRGYRDGGELDVDPGPAISVRLAGDHLELDAELRPDCLPPGRSLRLGLSAVVEDADGLLTYWALRHPQGKPDFHHIDAFSLQLELP